MSHFLPILLFTTSAFLTPGPNNLMIMNSGLNYGFKRTLPHYLGICCGRLILVLFLALGLGAIFIAHPPLKQALEIIGAAYMLFFAWKIAHASPYTSNEASRRPLTFLQAVLFQWVNPKAWVTTISIISLFTLSTDYLTNAILISLTCLAISLPCSALWCSAGKLLQKLLKTPQTQQYFNWSMAAGLLLSIILIFLETTG